MIKWVYQLIGVSIFFIITAFVFKTKNSEPDFLKLESRWVDSVYNSLNFDQRIGQLFMVAAYSNKDMKHVREIRELIQKNYIGGLIFMQGTPLKEARLNNYYQKLSKTPLLISIDGEWGLAMRLDSTPKYPRQMTLGAIQNDSLIFEMGKQIAKECKRMGIHLNFAPVADINNNALNPVIGMRSFGENKFKVTNKAMMYMKGLQAEGVMANGKHFPGHGDTDVDSHKELPTINGSKARLDSLELYPFKQLFDEGLSSIMVAHLFVPSYDTSKNTASTLSPIIVNDLLKQKMGFKGLVFTDALNMKGVSNYYQPGMLDVKALLAGNDVLLFSENVPLAIEQIKLAVSRNDISEDEIGRRCKKILKAKFWCGLNKLQYVKTKNLTKELNTKRSDALNTKLAEASVTLLKNENDIIPLKNLGNLKIVSVSIGEKMENEFTSTLKKYTNIHFIGIAHDAKQPERDTLLEKINEYDLVILQVNKTSYRPQNNFGCSSGSIELMRQIINKKQTITCLYTNPYLINQLIGIENSQALLMLYEDSKFSQKAAADAIVGSITINGKLPVSTKLFKLDIGLEIRKKIRLQYVNPEYLGIYNQKLKELDSLAVMGIKENAYPGCQIIAIKDGKVFYQNNFGKQTYHPNSEKVNDSTVYDLASLTKILSSSLSLMKVSENKLFDYTKNLSFYFPVVIYSLPCELNYKDILTHQAGLTAWIPFWQRTVDKKFNYLEGYYSDSPSEKFPTQVARNLYVVKGFSDTIYKQILLSKVNEPGKYIYSDVGYYFSKILIERFTKMPINQYVINEFYKPMNLGLMYLPLIKYPASQIAPTELDKDFRKQQIRGYVHDQGAALLGGVAGHAGLFGNANDVAIIMQMLLNNGNYGGIKFLDSNIIKEYTRPHFPNNRRGLCFDKPEFDIKKESPVVSECSLESFGHSGFTGTFAWADPSNGLIFIFLSNRIFPSTNENKLAKLGIRGKIHRTLYEALNTTIYP